MNSSAKRDLHSSGCVGEGCAAPDSRPLHHVCHRRIICRLCTSCVLKYHPGSFCASCFELFDASRSSDRPVIHCSKCPSTSHTSCLADSTLASQYICPSCANPDGFSYFPIGDGDEKSSIDLASAKVLLAAAQLAAASMSKAVVSARAETERKVKEAAMARKRAREMLERVFLISKEKKKELDRVALAPVQEVVEQKKKVLKSSSTVAAAMAARKKAQNREKEKWRRFQDPIPLVQRPVQGVADNNKFKGPLVAGVPNHVTIDMKDRVGSLSQLPNHVVEEDKVKKDDERAITMDVDTGPRIPQSTQDPTVSMTNSRAVFTGLPNSESLRS